jgi:hypothetical protein
MCRFLGGCSLLTDVCAYLPWITVAALGGQDVWFCEMLPDCLLKSCATGDEWTLLPVFGSVVVWSLAIPVDSCVVQLMVVLGHIFLVVESWAARVLPREVSVKLFGLSLLRLFVFFLLSVRVFMCFR